MPVLPPISEKLPESLAECHALIVELARDVAQYQSRIDFLTRRLFGRSAERFDPADVMFFGQNNFPGTETPAEPPSVEPAEPAVAEPAPAHSAAPSRRNGRRLLPADLPRARVERDVLPEQKIRAQCGSDKKRIGEETSEQLEYIPASLRVTISPGAEAAKDPRRCWPARGEQGDPPGKAAKPSMDIWQERIWSELYAAIHTTGGFTPSLEPSRSIREKWEFLVQETHATRNLKAVRFLEPLLHKAQKEGSSGKVVDRRPPSRPPRGRRQRGISRRV